MKKIRSSVIVILLLVSLTVLYGCDSTAKGQLDKSDQGAYGMNNEESAKETFHINKNDIKQVSLFLNSDDSSPIVMDSTHYSQAITELMSYINGAESYAGEMTADLNGELHINMADGTNYEFLIVGTTKFFVSKTDPQITFRFITEGNDIRFEEWANSLRDHTNASK